MPAPEVSILMAVFNGGSLLEKSIESIANQSFQNWEMVVVDDASTDGTRDIVGAWQRKDPRIRLITNETNKGQTPCLNQGLRLCRGEWIARQDADDISHPERLTEQLRFLQQNTNFELLGTQGTLIDLNDKKIGLLDVPCDEKEIRWCAPFLNPLLHTSVMFRRSTAEALEGYDESFRIAQDYELWTRMLRSGRAANLQQRLVQYRHTDTSLSKTGYDLAFAEADKVSAREAQIFFGREWSPHEKDIVSNFRKGTLTRNYKKFWTMIKALEQEKGESLPKRLHAMWHIRIAGSNRHLLLPELTAALRTVPLYTIRWLSERLFSS